MDSINVVSNKTDNIAIIVLFVAVVALGLVLFFYVKHSLEENKMLNNIFIKNHEESREDRLRYQENILEITKSNAADRERDNAALRETVEVLRDISKTLELMPIIQDQVCQLQKDVGRLVEREGKNG